ncbi:hypothetical protein VTI74DRAFT_5362 [Chaetomium olivicolor]
MEARQIFPDLTAAPQPTPTPTPTLVPRNCAGFNLPVGGVISLPNGEHITLTAAGAFKPTCTPVTPPAIIANSGGGSVNVDDAAQESPAADGTGIVHPPADKPFYSSTLPQCYALAGTTVVAYTLVIMLFITPRSFLDGGVVVLGRRGFTNGGTGPTIGGRPWLQKVAALTVAISLTIASVATFDAAEEQYRFHVQDAEQLQRDVLGGTELKVIRIISNTFLWLAQAQTLIRLFPRQREKVIIKWTAFALITLDAVFQSLNTFQYTTDTGVPRPGSFTDAIPALSYLFALSLSFLYAAWVIYYSFTKRRYAYWHPQMKNMCLVAVLSLLAILIPIVFFIADMINPAFTGWGEYVRWVGAAAASVIVWEWVERIEALEREEKKDGVLGREIFDGDEMLEMAPSDAGLRRRRKESGDGEKQTSVGAGRDDNPSTGRDSRWPAVTAITARYRSRSRPRRAANPTDSSNAQPSNHDRIRFLQPPLWPARPPPAVTPVSRTDTASADSTVYAIRYHPLTETTSRSTPPPAQNDPAVSVSRSASSASNRTSDDRSPSEGGDATSLPAQATPAPQNTTAPPNRWRALAQRRPLRTRRTDEEHAAPSTAYENVGRDGSNRNSSATSIWDLRGRLEEFAATQAERLREKFRPMPDTDSLPVTVIPAPPRRGAALAQLLEEEEREAQRAASAASVTVDRRSSGFSREGDEAAATAGSGALVGVRPPLRPTVTGQGPASMPGSFAAGTSRRLSMPMAGTPVSLPRRESESGACRPVQTVSNPQQVTAGQRVAPPPAVSHGPGPGPGPAANPRPNPGTPPA